MQNQSSYDLKIYEMADFDPCDLPEPVVENLMLAGEVSMLVGPSNTGKSAVAIRLSHHIVTGTPVLGNEVRPGLVIYVAAEGLRSVLSRAYAVFRDGEGAEHFKPVEVEPDLRDKLFEATVIEQAHMLMNRYSLGVSLVVFDTLILSVGDAEESSNEQMARVIRGARRIAEALSAHVLLVHHTGKDADRGARGASSLTANVDTVLLCNVTDREAGEVAQGKQRSIEKGAPFGYRLDAHEIGRDRKGRPNTAVVATIIEATQKLETKPVKIDPVELALETALGISKPATGFTTAELIAILPQRLFKETLKEDSRRRAVQRALEQLETQGAVRNSKDGTINRWFFVEPERRRAA